MLLHHDFIKIAKAHAADLALVDHACDKRLTYNQALIGSLYLARRISESEDSTVGILLPNTVGAVVAMIGTLMAGRTPVIINLSNPLAATFGN